MANCFMDESYILQMRDPWSLMYGEYEQDFIDVLREKIGPKHPLYNQEVYAIAVRRNPGAVLYQAFNDGFYAIVYFRVYQRGGGGCRRQRYSLTNRPSVKRLPPITPNSWPSTSVIERCDRPQPAPACNRIYVRL